MKRVVLYIVFLLASVGQLQAGDLPWWVDAVAVTPPNDSGVGSITLSGEWLDTCVPGTISHDAAENRIDLTVEHPGINVGCGDAITPWSLTESFGPLSPGTYSIYGTLYAVDPSNPELRELVQGPDLLVDHYVVPEPSVFLLLITGVTALTAYAYRRRPTA